MALVSHELVAVPGRDGLFPLASHSFDGGAAWAHLALQAHLWGWSTHAMGDFNSENAHAAVGVPSAWRVEVFIAVWRRGDASPLPEWARAREKPSDRKPLAEIVRESSLAL